MALRQRRDETAAVPSPSSLGRSVDNLEMEFRRLDSSYGQLKVFIAQESPNGDHFVQPLSEIQRVLRRAVLELYKSSPGAEGGESPAISQRIEDSVYALATEKLPQMIAYMPRIKTFKQEMGVLLLDALCYVMALEKASLSTFPSTFASCLLYLPDPEWEGACDEIVSRLCHYVLPMCLVRPPSEDSPAVSHFSLGTSAALMMVLQGCEQAKHHLLIADTLMHLKRDVCIDILSVVAYGASSARQKALNLLLHYWPLPQPAFARHPSSTYGEWSTPNCESDSCRRSTTRATVLCLNPLCASQHKKGLTKLYMLLCPDCNASIHGSTSTECHLRLQLPQPLRDVKPNCEFQKICSGKDWQVNKAEVTCYDGNCTRIQNGQPIRMCRACHNKQHGDISDPKHIFQVGPPDPWSSDDLSASSVMLEAVSKLLEIMPISKELPGPQGTVHRPSVAHLALFELEVGLSREGIWLLAHYCTPTESIRSSQRDWLVHLVALVLEWLQCYNEVLMEVQDEETPLVGPFSPIEATNHETEYARLISNYGEISDLVKQYVIPWLQAVCITNVDCVSDTLRPSLRSCAQVGKLWDKSHTTLERYQRTLTVLHQLSLLCKEKGDVAAGGKDEKQIALEKAFMKVFNSVMPQWLEILVQLRMEPGKMEKLQHNFQQLFKVASHDEGLQIYDFLWEKFRSRDPAGRQKALFWLQDLTRLKVPIPYLPHMFEDGLKERKGRGSKGGLEQTSFDKEMEERKDSSTTLIHQPILRKESTGSLSGYESESALVSGSSIDQSDTQMVISLNSSIARFILMLDIWLAQLPILEKENITTLGHSVFRKILLQMLMTNWGSSHTFQDHRDASNMCLLCRAMSLWFSVFTRLIEEYAKRDSGDSVDTTDSDLGLPTLETKRSRTSLKKITTPTHKRKKAVVVGDSSPAELSKSRRGSGSLDPHEGVTTKGGGGGKTSEGELSMQGFPPAAPKPKKKLLKAQSCLEFTEVSRPSRGGLTSPPYLPPAYQEESLDECIPAVYKIFQLCIDKLTTRLHPDAMRQIVLCLTCLVNKTRVLEFMEFESTTIIDIKNLFHKLWNCIESESSNVSRSCVGLLLDCVQFLSTHEPRGTHEVEAISFWKLLTDRLSSSNWTTKFKTVEKFTVFLQFIQSSEVADFHSATQATIAHGFCLLVELLQDTNSNVCSRAEYCITSIKESSIEAMKIFLVKLFSEYPSHRSRVLQALSLLASSLPELHLLSIDLFNSLIYCLTTVSSSASASAAAHARLELDVIPKKVSETSILSSGLLPRGPTPKISTASTSTAVFTPGEEDPETAALLQQTLALMLRYLGNPLSDCMESIKKSQSNKSHRRRTLLHHRTAPNIETSPEETLVEMLRLHVSRNFHCAPSEVRKSGIFAVFLNHIFEVFDRNIEFGQTMCLLHFVLRLLAFSAAPQRRVFTYINWDDSRQAQITWNGCPYSLASVPPKLQAPWLRVFFVILYKYMHLYAESDAADREILTLARWCLEITLNTLEVEPHVCSLLNLSEQKYDRPALQRQNTIESCGSSGPDTPTLDSPLITVAPASGSRLVVPQGNQPREREREGAALTPVPEETESSGQHRSGPGRKLLGHAHEPLGPTTNAGSNSSAHANVSDTSLKATAPVSTPAGICSICGKVTNEFTEEVIALCVVAVGTCSHRMPETASTYLVSRIIPAISKVTAPGSYPWQTTSESEPPPGSAMAVASRFLSCILTQFADRHLFLYLFGHSFGSRRDSILRSIAEALQKRASEGEGGGGGGGGGGAAGEGGEVVVGRLHPFSPVKYFLEDVRSSVPTFNQEVRRHSLINLATYMEMIPSAMPMMMREIPLWDVFCKRLKTHKIVLQDSRAMHSFLRMIISLLRPMTVQPSSSVNTHTVQSFAQSLSSVIEAALHNVYIPLGGLVQLASLWYQMFQQQSQRESEKFVRLYIAELRKALKARSTADTVRPDNFLSLIQVLLLEENGYLGYVDSLTEERVYAPILKNMYETHCLTVINNLQWDFVDVLQFISSHNLQRQWPVELIPQMKLSLAQLVALRVQHRRPPLEHLKRVINAGDVRAFTAASSKPTSATVPIRWQDYLTCIHTLAWLMLGAMCHNAIDTAAGEMTMKGGNISGQCRLFYSLDTHVEVHMKGVANLAAGALSMLDNAGNEPNAGFLYLTFMFTAIWTVYMELYEPDSTPYIVDFWQKFITQLITLLSTAKADDNYCKEIVHLLNDWVVVRLKRIGLSCFAVLVPIWREVTRQVADPSSLTFPDLPPFSIPLPVDIWYREAVKELVLIEGEWQLTDTGTAVTVF